MRRAAWLLAAGSMAAGAVPAWSQSLTAGAAAAPDSGPDSAGARIAAQGVPDKGVAACVSCHGAHGEGNAQGGFPRIAGLPERYLAKQLADYASGARNNPIMAPIAKGLGAGQIQAVAAFYASGAGGVQPAATAGAADAATAGASLGVKRAAAPDRAPALATVGDAARRIQACANCHGPGGTGEPPSYPWLAGQHPSYLVAALKAWKDGSRNNDPSGQMASIGRALKDDEITALARYYASQPAVSAAAMMAAAPARQQLSGPVDAPSGPRSAGSSPGGAAARGVGAEQGGPTTGGSTGPGGGGGATGSGPSGSPGGQTTGGQTGGQAK